MITVHKQVCYRAESFDEIFEVFSKGKEVDGFLVSRFQIEVGASYEALLIDQIQRLREEVAELRAAIGSDKA